ncbi:M15 family metallopeptidase [Kribbella sp. WER1]
MKGAPGELLVHWAAWFHAHVERIDVGEYDDWGYAERPIRGSTTTLSNHASGTAIDLNAVDHPLGRRGTFTAAKTAAIRARLKAYGGCIRWGGDYKNRADEMHFEIVRDPDACAAVLRALTSTPTGTTATRPPAAKPQPEQDDDMPTEQQLREIVKDEVEKYFHRFFSPGGTGKDIRDQLTRIESGLKK